MHRSSGSSMWIGRGSKIAGAASLALGIAGGIAGCGEVGPDYRTPHVVAPSKYGETHMGPSGQPETKVNLASWWKTFNDPELQSLIDRALDGNLSIQLAEMRVREARASQGVQTANLFPFIDFSGSVSRNKNTSSGSAASVGTGTNGTSGTGTSGTGTSGTGTSGTGTSGSTSSGTSSNGTTGARSVASSGLFSNSSGTTPYSVAADATWELDLWGGLRRAVEAAQYNTEAMVDARRFEVVTIASEVAADYVMLRGLQRQMELTYSNLKTEQDSLDLTRSRFKAGLDSDLDVAQAQAQVATTAAQLPSLEITVKQQIHAISVLLGEEPMALAAELGKETPIPPTPSEVPTGLPSELLRRRPDVLEAEYMLAQSTANIGVQVDQLFPHLSLVGDIGDSGNLYGVITHSTESFWTVGPSVSWRIFDSAQLINEVRVANAQQQEALLTYKQTVLTSFQDVEDALVAYAQDQNRTKALTDAVSADQRAVDLSTQLYTRGLGDFLNVLTAEQSLFGAQTNLAVSQTNVSSDLISLYRALGGGWDEQHENRFRKNEDPKTPIVLD